MTPNAVDIELGDSQAWLKSQFGLLTVPSLASPYGAYKPSVLSAVSRYYRGHRTVNRGPNFKDSNVLQLRSHDVHTGMGVDTVRTWINDAARDGSWLILTFHQLVTGKASSSTEYGATDFAAILDAIQASDVDTVTVSEGVARMEGVTSDPAPDTPVYTDPLGDGFTDWSSQPHGLNHHTVVRTGQSALAAVYFDDLRLLRSETPPEEPPAPPQTQPFTLYGDSLHATFKDRSGAVRNLGSTGLVHAGTSAISFEPDSWKSLLFNTTTRVDLSLYKTLSLWVNGGSTGGQVVRVMVKEDSYSPTPLGDLRLNVALGHAIKPNTWEQVLILLTSLNAGSRLLQELYIQDQSGKNQGTLHIDDIQLLP